LQQCEGVPLAGVVDVSLASALDLKVAFLSMKKRMKKYGQAWVALHTVLNELG
jgi:hypothetical protein